ncbi:MAG: peptidylprolyl isomerase [Hyphomicrobiaceae bacterium]
MSCSLKALSALPPRTPVHVNGVVIGHDAISREAQHHPAAVPSEAWQEAARALAVRELLLQEARKLNTEADPIEDERGRRETEDEALVRALVDQEVSTPMPDETACRRYYEQNVRRFRSADLYQASHILIAARRDEPDAFCKARTTINRLIPILAERPDAFAELAAAHSACPSAKTGGNLGQITEGDTTPEFERALFELSEGETTMEPVETPYGLHIIRLDRKIAGQVLPFEVVRERIASYLSEKSRRAATAQYLARLASQSEIAGVDMPTPADLRVY